MKTNTEICAIVAVGPYDVIGRNGVMPWYCQSDLAHFRKITFGNPCIFGRTTFENLPKQPLDGRFNLVVSSHYKNEYIGGVFYASSVENALSECSGAGHVFICGGAQIYKYTLAHDLIDTMYITIIKNTDLAKDIQQNPGVYCRFPFCVKSFLESKYWVSKPLFYSPDILHKDDGITIAEFYKCTRIRDH